MTVELSEFEIATLLDSMDADIRQNGMRRAHICLPVAEKLLRALPAQLDTQNPPTGHSERTEMAPEVEPDP